MNDKFFLDTNVFVYSFESSASAKARRATQLVRQGISTGKGVISFQVVQEFFNVALKRFAKPMTPEDAEQYLAAVFRPLLAVHSSPALYHEALEVVPRYRLAWYDGLIVASALQGQCGTLYSEDEQHGQRFRDLRVQNPFL